MRGEDVLLFGKPFVLSETLRLRFVKYFESKAFNNLDTHFFYVSASRLSEPDTSVPVCAGPLQCRRSKRWMPLSCLLRRSHRRTHATLFGRMTDKTKTNSSTHGYTDSGPVLELSCTEPVFFCVCVCVFVLLQREVVPSTRLAAIPPAFSIRTLPAQATEYAFAFIQIPQDVSATSEAWRGAQGLRCVSRRRKPQNELQQYRLPDSFSPGFSKLTFLQDMGGEKTALFWVSLMSPGDKSVTDGAGRGFHSELCCL